MAAAPSQPGLMQQQMDPLAQLRDIHQPGIIETWPPAPGWWLLAAIALGLIAAFIIWLYKRWRDDRYRREALKELEQLADCWRDDGDDLQYLQSLQNLLKRVALTRFPREEVASLTGEAWLRFLDRSTGTHDFSIGESEILIDGNYRSAPDFNVEQLQSVAVRWIREHHQKHLINAAETAA